MRKYIVLATVGLIATTGSVVLANEIPEIQRLIDAHKVHKMVVTNGDETVVQYFVLANLTRAEMEAVAKRQKVVNSPDNKIQVAADLAPPAARDVITYKIDSKDGATFLLQSVDGIILPDEGDWKVIDRGDGKEYIHKALVVRMFKGNR